MIRPGLLFIALLVWPGWLAAQEAVSIPAEELAHGAPAPDRIAALVERSLTQGWGGAIGPLRTAAIQAYESDTGYAPAWYYLYRWAELLGTPQGRAVSEWISAVEKAGVGHANMETSYQLSQVSLGGMLSPEFQRVLLGNAAFSEEFFTLLSPLDNPEQVLAILQKIYAQNPAQFADYQSLALAIAVVYDVPPPPTWPHGQVGATVLPRKLPPPERAFAYWVRLDRGNLALHRLRRLPASELKFLVDEVAPFAELDWARQQVPATLADLAQTYGLVKYRMDRITQNHYLWLKPDYRLATILGEGGICVDQAYFASTVGKAKGVPTILFRGAGLDGRHAWFGYLDGQQRWQLDCGRYAEQKFVVGLAYDPQTWGDINDHELLFITERFRALPTFKLSVMHADFAKEYLRLGKPDLALKAAREAVNRERRNLEAWRVLLQAAPAAHPEDPRAKEAVLHEALFAFQKYPDLVVDFSRQLAEQLRLRGETSAASFAEQQLGQKYQADRTDLSIQQAADKIERSIHEYDLATQIKVFNQVLDGPGRGAGIDFFDKVVAPFVRHLVTLQQLPAALQSLEHARHTLRMTPGSQVEVELNALVGRLKSGKS